MIRMLFGVLCFVLCCGPVLAEAPTVHVAEPRAFGYFIGDVLTRTVWISVDDTARIDPASVPKPGASNYWLELRSVSLEEVDDNARRQYKMLLQYQTFYAPLEPRKLQIPAVKLRVINAQGGDTQAVVPSWSFLSSPLREIIPEQNGGDREGMLRPDVQPRLISTAAERTGMAVSAAIAIAMLALLVHHFAIWPFHRRKSRPFSRAMRSVLSEAAKEPGDGDYRGALIALHRAFDEAARRRILAADLDSFLMEHPEFERLKPQIERFFSQSARVFFADDLSGARNGMPLPQLAAFAAALSERERSA